MMLSGIFSEVLGRIGVISPAAIMPLIPEAQEQGEQATYNRRKNRGQSVSELVLGF